MTTIRYFIPEDGDTEAYPNVFLAPKPRQPGYPPTLGEVKNTFPLSGRYHFRFKSPLVPGTDRDKGAMAVWLDCVDDRQPVPTWKHTIVAKVTRIGIDEDDEDDDDFVRPSAPSSNSAPTPIPAPSRPQHTPSDSSGPSLDIFDGPSPSLQSQRSISAPTSTGSLLDGHSTPVTVTSASSGPKDSLLDMNGPVFSSQSSPAHHDFFGMTTPPIPTNPNPSPSMQQAPMSGGYQPQQQQRQNQQYGMSSQQQQQQAQQQSMRQPQNNAFNSFSQQKNTGPFGDLGTPWK